MMEILWTRRTLPFSQWGSRIPISNLVTTMLCNGKGKGFKRSLRVQGTSWDCKWSSGRASERGGEKDGDVMLVYSVSF
jgi:hypothetical protein